MQCHQFKSTIPKTVFLSIRLRRSFQKKKGRGIPPKVDGPSPYMIFKSALSNVSDVTQTRRLLLFR